MATSGTTGETTIVQRSIDLDAPLEEVWDAITDEAMLREWLAPEVEIDPTEGGELACVTARGERRTGSVELVEEAERLAFVWRREGFGESRVDLVIEAVPAGTRLTVTETGLSPTAAPQASAAWGKSLAALRLALASLVYA